MALKFIIDTQLPPSLEQVFDNHGLNAIHTTDFPQGHLMNDMQITKIAISQNRIIVTKDSDFFDRYLLKGSPPKVLLLEIGNVKNAVLCRFIEEQMPQVKRFFSKKKAKLIVLNTNKIAVY